MEEFQNAKLLLEIHPAGMRKEGWHCALQCYAKRRAKSLSILCISSDGIRELETSAGRLPKRSTRPWERVQF